MKQRVIGSVIFVSIVLASFFLINRSKDQQQATDGYSETQKENKENKAIINYMRWKYEADMIKDPTTGEALFGLRDKEIEFAQTIPARSTSSPFARLQTQNNYLPAGPNNQGGRTRAVVYDRRYNGTTNRVIIAGGISGGVF